MNLRGVVDLHLHSAPDVRPRSIDDLTAARAALANGMRGVVLKNHLAPTADRAAVARLAVPGAPVFGGIVLNPSVGGLNPDAVEACARAGGRVVWLPTFGAAHHVRQDTHPGATGVGLLDARGKASRDLQAVLEVVASHGLLLATGHASPAETLIAVPEAFARGVRRVLVTHPENRMVAMTHEDQATLASHGAFLERVYAQPGPDGQWVPNFPVNADAIRAVGVASTVIASDLGQPENPVWPDGLDQYLTWLRGAGFTSAEIDTMGRTNPAHLLGI
ncbi:MAG: hypothetical protein EXR45_04850 [Chloroflexi bacterium]|nr:hypothetical protein [Chloroflexota bacterium]